MATPINELADILRSQIAEKEGRVREITKLLAERDQLTNDLIALKRTLAILKPPEEKPASAPVELFNAEITHFHQLGLTDAIRTVLKAAPYGLRPIEIAAELDKRGYQVSGTQPLPARVAAEISRMRHTGKAAKREGKYFAVGG